AANLPFSKFVDSGSTVTYGYTSPVTTADATKQYRWLSTTGLSQTAQNNTFTVSAAGTVTGTYVVQYQVTFEASANAKGDGTGTVVTVDASAKTAVNLPFSKFVDSGSTVTYGYTSPVTTADATKQYRWPSTTGLSQTAQNNTFTVSGAGTVTGTYVAQYQVTFEASANAKGDGTGTVVTVDASAKTAANLPFSKFVDSGSTVTYGYTSPVTTADATKQYRWLSTTGLSQTAQ